MWSPEKLVSEFTFYDDSNHLFHRIRIINKPFERGTLGIYGNRLDAANLKIRYAASNLIRFLDTLKGIEYGEVVYFDDNSRLEAHESLESFLIFLRASLDLVTGAWWVYNTGNAKVDSFNELLKKMYSGLDWHPVEHSHNSSYWVELMKEYKSENITWLNALIGSEKGQSLRDIAVHRSVLEILMTSDERGRDAFAIRLNHNTIGYASETAIHFYEKALEFIAAVTNDIEWKESSTQMGSPVE